MVLFRKSRALMMTQSLTRKRLFLLQQLLSQKQRRWRKIAVMMTAARKRRNPRQRLQQSLLRIVMKIVQVRVIQLLLDFF